MTTTTQHSLPMILAEVEVAGVERLSPSFVRVELTGPELADLGVGGPFYDQRIKLVFPNARGALPSFRGADESWFSTWLEIPAEERGHMRTYTIREVRGSGTDTRMVVDFVLHPGAHGPGSDWAATARVGDRLVTVAPRRDVPFGGIEFAPGTARRLLLAADETAVPAVCSILAALPGATVGAAFLEVPEPLDVQQVPAPAGMAVTWLPRDGGEVGSRLHPEVLAHLGEQTPTRADVADTEVEPNLWETPSWSSSGEELGSRTVTVGREHDDLYAWIAGESKVVTGLRRHLVRDLGIDRRQVAFMGYWRQGVAMRS